MELVQLRHFVTIAETLSFTKAAELAHISQPALSYQIKRLEKELGVELFTRRGRSITLTSEGDIFLPMAQSLLARANEAVRMVRDQSGIETGEVSVGLLPSLANYLAPELMASYHQVFPRVHVNLVENGDLTLQQRVASGAADFAIVSDVEALTTLDSTHLGSETLFVVTSPSHRLANEVTVELSQLRNEEFTLPSSDYRFREQIVETCRREGFEPEVAYTADTMGTLKGFVRAGLAVSILPALALVGMFRNGMAVLRIKDAPARNLYLVRSKDRDISQPAQVLLTHMRSAVIDRMTFPPRGKRATPTSPD